MFTVFVDLETGGVEPQHPVIQLAAIAVDDTGTEKSWFNKRLAFDVAACDPKALEINHYDPAAWQDAEKPEQAIARFAAWLKNYSSVSLLSKRTGRPYSVARLAGYNIVSFDGPRLRALFGTQFFPCEYLHRDILQRALFYFDEHPDLPKPENFKLGTVCTYFGIEIDGAHDALVDVRLSAKLARRLAA